MRKELHITASVPQQVQTCKENFHTNHGYGTIELTPYGDYLLNTVGITDAAARRTNEYKNAYKKVSANMLHAYEAETRAYTSLHRNMPSIESVVKLKNDLMILSPQKYKRGHFAFRKPTKDDVEKDLVDEVKNINFDKTNTCGHVDEKIFVKEHINEMIEIRQHAWQEACDFFNKIEDAREERENAKFFTEYKTLYNNKKEYLEGNENTVKQELLNLCGNVSVPYNLSLSFAYSQTTHVLETAVVMEDGISVPISKATILASGKISIKNKLVRETITEKTNSAVSLTYFLAAHLFNTSPNIQYLRLSLYERSKQNPLLWVEFEREKFSRTRPKMVDVISDILGYPNVLEFKNKADAIELCTTNKVSFDHDVAMTTQRAEEIHSKSHLSNSDIGNGKIAISFDDAKTLTHIPHVSSEVRKAIAIAKDKGDTFVTVDKKMRNFESLNTKTVESNAEDNTSNFISAMNLDPLFEEAAHAVVLTQEGSTSMLQRRFSIGYIRAERLMDQLESCGIVGFAMGAKPRKVLINNENQLGELLSHLR